MNLALSETQQLLQQTARAFLAEASPPALVRQMAADPVGLAGDLWRSMAAMGWTGLLVPEDHGGIGGSMLDAVVLFEQIGHFLPPAPIFETAVSSALVIQHAGSAAQQRRLLPGIADGRLIVSVAFPEADGTWDPASIAARLDGGRLTGQKLFVPDAHIANWLIVVCRDGKDLRAVLVDPNAAQIVPLDTIGRDRQFAVTFNDVAVAEVLPGGWDAIQEAILRATIVKCAEMIGGSQHALDMSVAYAKQRVAFGRPIGAFQAIQHECAELAAQILGLRIVVYETAWKIDEGLPAALDVAVCKDMAGEVFRDATTAGHQIHAGLAFTLDHDLNLFHRRVPAADALFGDSDYQKDRAAVLLDLGEE